METIRFSDVTFTYPLAEKPALDGISLEIPEAAFVVVCGRSGCGKSTLLRHMKKNLTPYGRRTGEVTYEGDPVMELDDRRSAAEIGFVQQNPDNQLVTDKVWHELAFGLESMGLDNQTIRRRVAEMASYFDIQTWFRRDVSQLSGGQKQLLNLASIMAMQPRLLVLDEPTSQLDPIAASEFLRTIYKINRDIGTTVVMSEHRLEEAFPMADQVVVMDHGQIIACDAPRRIGRFMAGDTEEERHPMFYGLPAITKIFHGAGGQGESPLTIREGRLWLQDLMAHKAKAAMSEKKPLAAGKADQNRHRTVCPDSAISLKEVWFRYDRHAQDVLRGLTLEVPKSRLFCLLGGNGVGKSTTLKAICRMIKPQRGKIRVEGKLAMLPQNPQALFTEVCVEDELMEALYRDPRSDEEKVEAVMEMLRAMEIEHLRKAHPYDLSGGEQQRLALGKVLLLDPEVILLDEPTKGLDPFFKRTLAKVFRKLTEEGKTLFMVSHDIEFCAEYGDDCALFFDGEVVSAGEARAFFRGNSFYTTTANRMAREYFPQAITWEEVAACVHAQI